MAKLQKSDLAKEFSDVVQQEIKNHNDLLLGTNMAIEEMRKTIATVKDLNEKKLASLASELTAHIASLEGVKQSVVDQVNSLKRELNNSIARSKEELVAFQKVCTQKESYFLTLNVFEKFTVKVDEWISHIKRAFSTQKDTFSQETNKILELTNASIEMVKKSIEVDMQKQKDAIADQDATLDIFAVNFDGLKREIEVLKKQSFIIEKNIENLYTQIERLKEKS